MSPISPSNADSTWNNRSQRAERDPHRSSRWRFSERLFGCWCWNRRWDRPGLLCHRRIAPPWEQIWRREETIGSRRWSAWMDGRSFSGRASSWSNKKRDRRRGVLVEAELIVYEVFIYYFLLHRMVSESWWRVTMVNWAIFRCDAQHVQFITCGWFSHQISISV